MRARSQESESRIQNEKSKSDYLFSTDYWLRATDYSLPYSGIFGRVVISPL